ncbi:MAG: hypothetical protein KTR14_11645, partial [Vampirovibrio sp.]|nr:hypothetical protein [Vampirovibrio sp.]
MAIDRTREIRSGSAPAWKKTPTSPAKRASEEEAKAKPLETGGSDEIVVAGMGAPAVKTATDSVLPKSEEAEAETATETTVAEESREASTEIVEQEKDTSLFGFLGDMFHSGVEKVSGVLGEVTSVVKDIPDFLGWIISGITGFLSDLFGFGGNDDDSPDTSSTVEPASAPLPTPEPTESPKEPDASEPTTGEPGIVEDVAPDATEPTIVRVNPVDEPDDEAVIAGDTVTYDLDVAEEVDPKPTITTRVKDESITSGPDDTVIAKGDVGESDEATVAVVETEIDPPDGSATKESFVSAAQDTASYIVGELFGFRPASAEEDAIAEGPELTAQDRNARLRHLRMQAEGISSKRFREYQEQESALVKAEENSAALAQKLEAAEASMAQARQAASAEVEALQTQLVEARELAKTDAATAADQQSRIAELTIQLRAAKAKQNLQAQQNTRTISDLRKQLRQADVDKKAVEAGNRKVITQLTRKLEQAEASAAEAETKIDLMEGRILTLAQQRNAIRAERDTKVRLALEKASDARKELRQRDLDLKVSRDELAALTKQHIDAEAAFKQQADVDAETRRRLELAAQNLLAKKNEAETRLNLQERQHVVQIGDLNRTIRQARQDARVLQDQANEKIDALTSELTLVQSQLKQQSQTLAATEDALSQKTEALEHANAQTVEAQAREAEVRQELANANEKIENSEAAR